MDETATHIPEGSEAIMVVDSKALKAHEVINFTAFRADTDEEIGQALGKTGHYSGSYKIGAGKITIPKGLAADVAPEKMEVYFKATHKQKNLEVKSPNVEITTAPKLILRLPINPESDIADDYTFTLFTRDDMQSVGYVHDDGKAYLPIFNKDEDKPDI